MVEVSEDSSSQQVATPSQAEPSSSLIPIENTQEYPELEKLRKAALVRQKLQQAKADQKRKYPKWDLLQMILWKNMTIRKRRKTQFILLLFQIFLWFGIACFSIVWRSAKFTYNDEPNSGLTQLVPRLRPHDLTNPIAISYNRNLDVPEVPTSLNSSDTEIVSTTFTPFQQTLLDVSKSFLNYYKLTYNGTIPRFRIFKSLEAIVDAMREDKRIPYGIYFDDLNIEKGQFSYQLLFWQKEVPIDQFDAFDCRKTDRRYAGGNQCGMTLYGKYGFTFAQTALANAIIETIGKRQQLIKSPIIVSPETDADKQLGEKEPKKDTPSKSGDPTSLIERETKHRGYRSARDNTMYHILDKDGSFLQETPSDEQPQSQLRSVLAPNKFRLEFPGVSLVAERFPEHRAVRSQAKEIAPSAPFYFMFALVSVFSFVVMDMVMEKESK